MAHQKQALDSAAEQYWTDYFGDYGKAWVKKVPKRVALAVAKRVASSAKQPLTHAVVAPYGYRQREDGGLHFEGAFRGMAGETPSVHRAFSAVFDKDGALVELEVV